MSKQSVIESVSDVMDVIETKINAALAKGTPISGTTLGKEIAVQFGLSVPQTIALVSLYVNGRQDLVSRKGKGGGIQLKK